MKHCFFAGLIFLASTAFSFASVSISSPVKGDHVTSPFYLAASSTSCSSQPISSIGYSLDNSSDTAVKHGSSSIATNVAVSTGTHTVHVKAWNIQGAVCVTDVAVTVTGQATGEVAEASAASSTAGINISSPSKGQNVSSPFTLAASASSCSSQSVRSIGYSLDNSSETTVMKGASSISTKVSASAGSHTVHVKTWGNNGSACAAAVPIIVTTVTDDVVANTAVVPSNAVSVSNIEMLKGWSAKHDTGAKGSASGTTSLVSSPSHSGSARKFVTSYKSGGAMRYSISFGDNRTATNFMYDAWVYFTSSSSHIGNLEMDVNQTMPNGQTVIFGVQCDGYSGKWAYTENLGSASKPKGHWTSSSAACNPRNWSTGKWHHVQISYSRNSTGHVTYKYVWFDGAKSTINRTVFAARALGWGSSISSNFQVDGLGSSGTVTVYLDSLAIHRW